MYLTSFKIKGIEGDTYFPDYAETKFKVIHVERTGISGDCFRIMERMSDKEKLLGEGRGTIMPSPGPAPVDMDEEVSYNSGGSIPYPGYSI